MHAYKIETIITNDGKIILPPDLSNIFNHKVEIVVLDKEIKNKRNVIEIPSFHCGGKLANFTREELYEPRI